MVVKDPFVFAPAADFELWHEPIHPLSLTGIIVVPCKFKENIILCFEVCEKITGIEWSDHTQILVLRYLKNYMNQN